MKIIKTKISKEEFIEDWAKRNLYTVKIVVGDGFFSARFIIKEIKETTFLKYFSKKEIIEKAVFSCYDAEMKWWAVDRGYLSDLEKFEFEFRREFPDQPEFYAVILRD